MKGKRRVNINTGAKLFGIIVALCCASSGLLAQGTGLYFLSDAPLAKFSNEDRQIFRAAAIGALDTAADGVKVPWSNPDTDARGVITPLETLEDDVYGLCRSVRVTNERAGLRRSGVYRACKSTTGTWRLLTAGS